MKTIITAIALSSLLVFSSAYAQEVPAVEDNQTVEAMVKETIDQHVYAMQTDVKLDALVELGQYLAELKSALNPARVLTNVADVAIDLITNNEE